MARRISARRIVGAISLFAACSAFPAAVREGQPEFTYRTQVNEVRLIFSVTDQNDRGLATLQANDFAVVDNGTIVRKFRSFNRSDATKIEIAIVVDASESVSPRFRPEIAGTFEVISHATEVPAENFFLFYCRGPQAQLACAGDCPASHIFEQLPQPQASGLTPLFDSIILASDFLAQHGDAGTERVMILFSDGEDTISRSSLNDAIRSALTNDVQIYSIDTERPGSEGTAILRTFAAATGGRCFSLSDGATRVLNMILERLRGNYSVNYVADGSPGFHSIRIVPTHNLALEFRSRTGYYYPKSIH